MAAAAILDGTTMSIIELVRNSLSIAFLAILDQYRI